jgi:hypothetical protein
MENWFKVQKVSKVIWVGARLPQPFDYVKRSEDTEPGFQAMLEEEVNKLERNDL